LVGKLRARARRAAHQAAVCGGQVIRWAVTRERAKLRGGRASSRPGVACPVLRVGPPGLALSISGFDNGVSSYHDALYLLLQLEARRVVGASPIEQVLARRAGFGPELLAACAEPARALGLELEAVDVKDLILPGDLKRIFAKVVEARQEGLAALERARGETAALRNLANAARLLEASPALAQLRLLQHLASTSGNTYVLGVPSAVVPLPDRPA
jgi:hypothetical protein